MPRVARFIGLLVLVQAAAGEGGVDCVDDTSGGKWHNALGASYDCEWYALYDNCEEFGAAYPGFNTTALEACCVCQPLAQAASPSFPPAESAPVGGEDVGAEASVSVELRFGSSGAPEEVAAALRDALLVIHGSESNLGVDFVRSGGRGLMQLWRAQYSVAAGGQQLVNWHRAIAINTNTNRTQTASILASKFDAASLEFAKETLAVGFPEVREPTSTLTATSPTRTTTTQVSSRPSTGTATTSGCVDFAPEGEEFWYDALGKVYDCEWHSNGLCKFADSYERFGMTASQACCACGGGARSAGAEESTAFPKQPQGEGDEGRRESQGTGGLSNEIVLGIGVSATVCVGGCILSLMGYVKVKCFPEHSPEDVDCGPPPARSSGSSGDCVVSPDQVGQFGVRPTMLDIVEALEAGNAGSRPSRGTPADVLRWHSEGMQASPSRRPGDAPRWYSEGMQGHRMSGDALRWHSEGMQAPPSRPPGDVPRWHSEGMEDRRPPTSQVGRGADDESMQWHPDGSPRSRVAAAAHWPRYPSEGARDGYSEGPRPPAPHEGRGLGEGGVRWHSEGASQVREVALVREPRYVPRSARDVEAAYYQSERSARMATPMRR